MYALVLSLQQRPALRAVDRAHGFVLDAAAGALSKLAAGLSRRGISDLAVGSEGRKFSGNSLRMKRRHLLYHGTLLYDFPLEMIAECLRRPPREPAYRNGRPHAAFVANLPLDRAAIRHALIAAWDARGPS